MNKLVSSAVKKIKNIKDKKVVIFFCLIIILGIFLRFYNFPNRWGLGDDSSRDVAIARVALQRHELPLIGSFSSAGPFAFGPQFYWFIMLCYFIFPWFTASPFVGVVLVSILVLLLYMYTAYLLGGKRFAVIVGLLVATSPQLIIRASILGQHSFIALAGVLTLLFFVLLWQKRNSYFALLMGLSIGLGIGMHYQAINFLVFLPALFFIPKVTFRKKLFFAFLSGIGILLAESPILYWDSQQQFANTRNILDYFLIAQYRLYVPNSWKLFIFTNIPNYWSIVTGGYPFVALSLFFITLGSFIARIVLKKTNLLYSVLFGLFCLLLLLNRFYKGERSEGYLLFLIPFIIVFTSLFIDIFFSKEFFNKQRLISMILGVAILLGVAFLNLSAIRWDITHNSSSNDAFNDTVSYIIDKYPNKKFLIYDYKGKSSFVSQPIGFLLGEKGLIGSGGVVLGFNCTDGSCPPNLPLIINLRKVDIVDLASTPSSELKHPIWVDHSPDGMYDDLIGESKKHSLTSSFSLQDYLLGKFYHNK